MSKMASVRGTAVGGSAALAELIEFIDAHGVRPPVQRSFAFEEAKEAYRFQAGPDVFGKVVIELAR